MDVEVHHGLAGGFADVDADVVAIGVEVLVEEGSGSPGEGEEGSVFLIGGVEEACDVAEGDEEEVAGARRELVIAGVAEGVCEDYVGRQGVTEGAGQIAHASYPRTWMR